VSEIGSEKRSAEVLVASPYSGFDRDRRCNGVLAAGAYLFNTKKEGRVIEMLTVS